MLILLNHYHDVLVNHLPEVLKIASAVMMAAAFMGVRLYPTKQQRCLLLSLGQGICIVGESMKSLSSGLDSIIPQNIIDQEAAAELANPGLAPVVAPQPSAALPDDKK